MSLRPPASPAACSQQATPRAGLGLWAVAVAGFFLLTAAWALADPLLSGPDEPAHLIRAEAIVRGQLIGRPESSDADNPATTVRVPGFLAQSNSLRYWCFIFSTDTTALCAPPLTGPDHLIPLPTYVGHYPPLYYLAVGWPSLLNDGTTGVLFMRLVSALINSLLLGSALFLAIRRSRLVMLALLVAVTPTVIYYSASVNPNGLEMTSAVCFWCAVLGLTMPWPSRQGASVTMSAPSSLAPAEIAIAAISGCVLASARGLSPAWLLIAVGAALIGGDGARMRALAHRRGVRLTAVVLSVAIAAAVAWIIGEHGLDELGYPSRSSFPSLFHQTLTATPHYLSEMVGIFGANNVPAPPFATTAVVVGLALIVLGAFVVGSWRERVVLALLLLAIVAVPVASGVATGHHYGLIWQGRYTLAVGVGSPIFAGYVVGAWFEKRRFEVGAGRLIPAVGAAAVLFALILAVAQFTSFLWDLRRFMVGADGPLSGVFAGIWHPPVDGFVLLVWAGCGALAVALLTLRAAHGRQRVDGVGLGRRSDGI
ncbi:MAG: DUF2142 domain-containing protein [Acidimicrobiales bacterium]